MFDGSLECLVWTLAGGTVPVGQGPAVGSSRRLSKEYCFRDSICVVFGDCGLCEFVSVCLKSWL